MKEEGHTHIFPHGKKLSLVKLKDAPPKMVLLKECFEILQEIVSRVERNLQVTSTMVFKIEESLVEGASQVE